METFERLLMKIQEIAVKFTTFKVESRAKSELFTFWDDYISMVQLLLQFIRAERTGDLETPSPCNCCYDTTLHRNGQAKLLPVATSLHSRHEYVI